jgi:hypothetical protein
MVAHGLLYAKQANSQWLSASSSRQMRRCFTAFAAASVAAADAPRVPRAHIWSGSEAADACPWSSGPQRAAKAASEGRHSMARCDTNNTEGAALDKTSAIVLMIDLYLAFSAARCAQVRLHRACIASFSSLQRSREVYCSTLPCCICTQEGGINGYAQPTALAIESRESGSATSITTQRCPKFTAAAMIQRKCKSATPVHSQSVTARHRWH